MRTSRKYKFKRGTIVLRQSNWTHDHFIICKVISSERKSNYSEHNEVTIMDLLDTNVNKIEDINFNLLTKAYAYNGKVFARNLQEFHLLSEEEINKILVFSS